MYTRLVVVQNIFEAQQIISILTAEGISATFFSYGDTALNGLYQLQKGHGEIRVDESQKEKAKQVLAEQRSLLTEVAEEEVERQSMQTPPLEEKAPTSNSKRVIFLLLILLAVAIFYLVFESVLSKNKNIKWSSELPDRTHRADPQPPLAPFH